MKTKQSISDIGRKAWMLLRIGKLARVKPFTTITTAEVSQITKTGNVPSALLERVNSSLNGCSTYAVRSSAVDEDGELSWAGQFVSKLDVCRKEISGAILECARASKSQNVASYQKVHGAKSPQLGLFVQEMVEACVAGVLFTRNPMGSGDQRMVIEAIKGTADRLVSGIESPRRWFVNPSTWEISAQGRKDVRLTKEQIKELVTTAQQLERELGVNDIEWAFDKKGTLFINQGRRSVIAKHEAQTDTGAKAHCYEQKLRQSWSGAKREKARLEKLGCRLSTDVLTNQNVVELLTSYPSTMGFGLFTCCFAHGNGAIKIARNQLGYAIGEELERDFFTLVAGQPRSSIIHDAFTYRVAGVTLSDYCTLVNHYLMRVKADERLTNYPEVVLYQQKPSLKFLVSLFGKKKGKNIFKAYRAFHKNLRSASKTVATEYEKEFRPFWKSALDGAERSIGTLPLSGLIARYWEVCRLLRTRACPMFVKVARLGFFGYARVRELIQEEYGKEADHYLNVLTRVASDRKNPNLEFTVALYNLKRGRTTIGKVCRLYGHLSPHELEISTPRFADQPQTLLQLSSGIKRSPELDWRKRRSKRSALVAQLRRTMKIRSEEFNEALMNAETYLALREEVKFEYLRGYALLRKLAVAIELKLRWSEGLIFYLKPHEVNGLGHNAERLRKRAQRRQDERQLLMGTYVPPVVSVRTLKGIAREDKNGNGTLKGIGVTNAVKTGEVVVVKSLDERDTIAKLKPGSILVTEQTDPAWAPALSIVGADGGLVTEVGGLLAHGAIYAREIGFAAVLNVPRATHVLKTGMRVEVNGKDGTVKIIS